MTQPRHSHVALLTFFTAFLTAFSLTPAHAATSAPTFSRTITGGSGSGSVIFYSTDVTQYAINYTVRDSAADGLCIGLFKTDSGSSYYSWQRVGVRCGANSSISSIARYDNWFAVAGVKVRVCTLHNGLPSSCSSAQFLDNPYRAW